MSRQSTEALAIATVSIPVRPEPPERLSKEEAKLWREIVDSKPVDWFDADTRPLLEAYCQAISFQWMIAREIATGFADMGSVLPLEKLHSMQEKNAKLLAQLATKMRLTPQSRYTPKAASTANRKAGGITNKPWA